MGGWLAVHTAAHLLDISHVVSVCPLNELLMTRLVEEVAMVQRGHKSQMVSENPPRVNVDSIAQLLYRLDILKAARRINPRPLLLIHSEADEQAPPHTSQRIYEEAGEPKALWLLPGGDHRFAQHDPGTIQRALEWLL